MQPLHVALFTDGIYPFVMGGMQKHSYHLAKNLANNNVKVTVYHCINENVDSLKFENYYTNHELSYINFITIPFPTGKKFVGHYLYYSYQYSKLLTQHFIKNNNNATILFAKGFTAWYLLANKRKLKVAIPVIIKFHGLEMWQRAASFTEKLKQYLLRPAVAYNLRKANAVVSYGGNITTIIQQRNVALSRITNIATGIDDSWISTPRTIVPSTIRIVFVGRYERRKGIQELHAAITQLQSNGNINCEFEFIGPIPQAMQLNYSNCIYHGSISNANAIKNILLTTQVLVCPSYAEGMPNVILEAMACGNAILATNVGSVSAMVGTQNGWLIHQCQVNTIANAITEIVASNTHTLLKKQNESIVKCKQKYLWTHIVLEYIHLFTTLNFGKKQT
jgi:glycosyltransferase involved in cell wall biosynthesis